MKKDYLKEILVLKSAFSVVDQMFFQEIQNAEIRNSHWFLNFFCWSRVLNVKDPEKLNKFISGIMDPFKDKEDEEKKQTVENDKVAQKRAEQKRKDEKQRQKEERKKYMKTRNIVCWPFCYSVPDTEKEDQQRYEEWKMNNKKMTDKDMIQRMHEEAEDYVDRINLLNEVLTESREEIQRLKYSQLDQSHRYVDLGTTRSARDDSERERDDTDSGSVKENSSDQSSEKSNTDNKPDSDNDKPESDKSDSDNLNNDKPDSDKLKKDPIKLEINDSYHESVEDLPV
jgi:hypothetical protein